MENTNKKSWRDISINEYYEIKDIIDDSTLKDYEKEVSILSLLTNKSEDEIWNMNVNNFKKLKSENIWIYNFNFDKGKSFKKIEIKGNKYNIDININNMTVAQYVDFQTYWLQRDNMKNIIGNLLAIFIIPKGKKYNEGYDINQVVNDIMNNIDIMTAEEILFFFLSSYLISIKITLNYLNLKMKMIKIMKKDKEKVEKFQKEIMNLEKIISDGFIL